MTGKERKEGYGRCRMQGSEASSNDASNWKVNCKRCDRRNMRGGWTHVDLQNTSINHDLQKTGDASTSAPSRVLAIPGGDHPLLVVCGKASKPGCRDKHVRMYKYDGQKRNWSCQKRRGGRRCQLSAYCVQCLACRWPKRQSKAVHVCSRVLPGNSGGGAALSALKCTHVLCAPISKRFVRPDGHIVPRHRPHVHSTFSSRGRLRCPMAMPLLTSFVPRV